MAHTSKRCWCHDITIPAALLQKVPVQLQGKACICQACIQSFKVNKS